MFKKSVSLFKGKIEKGSLEKGVESFGVWTEWASTKIEEHRMLNPLPKPKAKPVQASAPAQKEAAPKKKPDQAEP